MSLHFPSTSKKHIPIIPIGHCRLSRCRVVSSRLGHTTMLTILKSNIYPYRLFISRPPKHPATCRLRHHNHGADISHILPGRETPAGACDRASRSPTADETTSPVSQLFSPVGFLCLRLESRLLLEAVSWESALFRKFRSPKIIPVRLFS